MFKSKKEEYILAVGKNNFYLRYLDGKEEILFLENAKLNPNVPFFHYLFDLDASIKEINVEKKLFHKNIFYVLMLDDYSKADMKIIDKYLMKAGAMEIVWIPQNIMLSLEKIDPYISISKTIRCIIVSYISIENNIKDYRKKVLLDKDVTIDEIKKVVNNIKIEVGEEIAVYINNIDNDMNEFEKIGTLISKNEILDNTREFFNYGK